MSHFYDKFFLPLGQLKFVFIEFYDSFLSFPFIIALAQSFRKLLES